MTGSFQYATIVLVFLIQIALLLTSSVNAAVSIKQIGNQTYLNKPILDKSSLRPQFGPGPWGFRRQPQQQQSQIIVEVDSGRTRGVVSLTTLVEYEKYIRNYLLQFNALRPNVLQDAVDFRNARLGISNSNFRDVTEQDFDIYLSDYVDTFVGGAFGSFIVTYLSTNGGNATANLILLQGILQAQQNASNVVTNRTLTQDLKVGLTSQRYAGILPNPGTSQMLYYLIYNSQYLSLLFNIATQQQNYSSQPQFNPLGDPFRPSSDVTLSLLQATEDFTEVLSPLNGTNPWQYVNLLAFLFGNRQFSDPSIKTNLYIQTTDQVNSRPLAFYRFGRTFGYTTTNYSAVGKASITQYDGVDQSLWKIVDASTAYFNIGPGVAVDLGAQGVTILTDSGFLTLDPTILVLAIQDRFTRVPLSACKVLSIGPGYGIPTMRSFQLSGQVPSINSVLQFEFAVEGNWDPARSAYQSAALQQATNGNYVRVDPLFEDYQQAQFTLLVSTTPSPDSLAQIGRDILAVNQAQVQQNAQNAVNKALENGF